jgi:ABC-type nitrate/sulfonate/bicarbonate transport system permease component
MGMLVIGVVGLGLSALLDLIENKFVKGRNQ